MMTDNLHGFALTIADRSPLAAEILGLRYVDHNVKAGETYVYSIETKRLKSNLPPVDIRVINEFEPLLAPEGFSILKRDDAVNLRWLSNSNLTKYGSYIVERQNPGDTIFHVLTDPPLVFIKEPSIKQPYYHFIDSLHGNKGVFRYRVKGSNAFGEWSEYAYGLGYSMDRTPPEPVSLYSGDYQKDSNQIRLAWTIPINNVDIKYHQVQVSENEEYNYSAVSAQLPASDTVFNFNVKDMFIDRPFYFKIISVDSFGNQSTSIVRYVSVPDLEKPLPPTNLKVTIDTTGQILATWSPSKSHDVEGYYIFYSNDDESDFTMDDNTLQKDTFYTWNIPLNTLTKNIYLAIKAADDNYNRSNFSDIIKLRRPDKIPPPKPFLSQAFYDEESGVNLSWKQSSASDVEKYFVYRKNIKDSLSTWKLIDSTSKDVIEYNDNQYPYDTQVGYSIRASDDFSNISEFSNSIPVNIPFPKKKYLVSFQKIESSKNMNVNLTWTKPDANNMDKRATFKYQIFRSVGNDELELYKEVPSGETNLKDKVELKNVLYNYAIRIKFENGKTGKLSQAKSILIQ
ncbi:MAG: fibronectin type III domain-containing protein [Saprospiraceae bacterium]|nr:fibronectin type III domain-containing protein [Candidatus Vicinibacter affinis]